MASKRVGIFSALGGFAKGASQGISTAADLQKMVAENELKKMMLQRELQKDSEEKAYKAAKEAGDAANEKNNLRLKILMAQQPSSYTDAATGKTITIPGVPRETMDLQFPGVLEPPKPADSTTPPVPDIPLGSKAKFGDSSKENSQKMASPEMQASSLQHLKDLLTKIPADLSTTATVAASKLLGGQRFGFGSNEIKQYIDEAPGIAVGLYRNTTGDTRLSDADAKARALPYLPQVSATGIDTQEVRNAKINRLEKALQIAQREKSKNPNAVLDFDSVMAQAQKESQVDITAEQAARLLNKQTLTPDEQIAIARFADKHPARR